MDKLIKRIDELNSPTVVGLDPTLKMIPTYLKKQEIERNGETALAASRMLYEYNKIIIDSVCDLTPAVKPQVAMYERYGADGVKAYVDTIEYAKSKGLYVIGDIKRGDIGSTAEAYASHLEGTSIDDKHIDPWKEDSVTLNPYMGSDGITPFIDACKNADKDCFILVKTSNPSGSEVQDLIIQESGIPIYEHVGNMVSKWGESTIGECGYSRVGAVVGATQKVGLELREKMPHTFFLVPGYGAQGAGGKDLKGFFDADGRGCIVNSSRGIIAFWQKDERYSEENVGDAARDALVAMNQDLREAL